MYSGCDPDRHLLTAAFLLLTVVVVFAYHANADELLWPFLIWIGAAVLGTWAVDNGWFALLPLAAIPLAVPLGYPESDFEPLPTGYVVTVIALVAFAACTIVVFLTRRGR